MSERVDAVLAELGLPPSREVHPFSRSRRFANWKVVCEDDSSWLLRITQNERAHRGLLHEAAAHRLLADTDLPIVQKYWLIHPDQFDAPASLSNWLPGMSGQGVMESEPGLLPTVFQGLGYFRRVLEQQNVGAPGMEVIDGRFRAIRGTWREEYLARVFDWWHLARSLGADFGPLSDRILDRILALSGALDHADRFCLIHGDLRPVNTTLHVTRPPGGPPEIQFAGVFDWEFAVVGDALLGFALPLELPAEALCHLLIGYGTGAALQIEADPSAMDRLTVYSLGRVLQYQALVVGSQIEGGGPAWGRGMAYAVERGEWLLTDGAIRDRWREALPEEPPLTIPWPDDHTTVDSLLRRALGRLACRPSLGPSGWGVWLGVLASALRALSHGDEGWLKDGEALMERLGPEIHIRGYEPIPDRVAWFAGMHRFSRSGPPHVLGTWWLAVEAFGVLCGTKDPSRWSVTDDTLRGLESLLRIVAMEQAPAHPRFQLLMGVLALAAETHFGGAVAAARIQLNERWEDLTVFGEAADPEKRDDEVQRDSGGWIVPVALYASSRAELPMPRSKLIGVLC